MSADPATEVDLDASRAERRARAALTPEEQREIASGGMTATEYLLDAFSLTIAEFDDEESLVEARNEAARALEAEREREREQREVESRARESLGARTRHRIERSGQSATEYLREEYDVDAAEYTDVDALREARKASARGVDPDADPEDPIEHARKEAFRALGSELSASMLVSLRRMWEELRDEGKLSGEDLRSIGWGDGRPGGSREAFWRDARLYLTLLPCVRAPEDRGMLRSAWEFDADLDSGPDRPPVVDTEGEAFPADRVTEAIDAAAAAHAPEVLPGADRRTEGGLRRMAEHLHENGAATTSEVKALFRAGSVHQPSYDKWSDPDRWWRAVGRRALADLPFVDPPRSVGGEWRWIGGE